MTDMMRNQKGPLHHLRARAGASMGRQYVEANCAMRSPYQRDRDRIIHSASFRRLTHKTQVFVYHEGDHYRSRLTHSLEVAQIARSIARMLGGDEDLTEAIALAHDLGHTPFGHAGERALDRAMQAYGGFDHNAQSLKVVTKLEGKYPQFEGLNLSYECLEAIAKHNGPLTSLHEDHYIAKFDKLYPLHLETYCSLEGQIAALADDIAYNNHDIDDGLRAGLLTIDDLETIPLIQQILDQVRQGEEKLSPEQLIYGLNRQLITQMVADCVANCIKGAKVHKVRDDQDVRRLGQALAIFSSDLFAQLKLLRRFLFKHVYRAEKVMSIMTNAEQIVEDLYHYFLSHPDRLPQEWVLKMPQEQKQAAQHIGDFVAGMTDRYAVTVHKELFDHTPELG